MGENLKGRVAARTAKAQPVDDTHTEIAYGDTPEEVEAAAERGDTVPAPRWPVDDGTAMADPDADRADPECVPVQVALARVMAEVRSVGKAQLHKSQTAGTWRFRGIDDVLNAVGPALRNHGVIALPQLQDVTYRDVQTTGGKPSRECTVTVKYVFVGPDSSTLEVVVPGESMDHGDKGTAKAMSVALRIALLQALALPTDQPDPDSQAYERAAPAPDPAAVALAELQAATAEHGWSPKRVAEVFATQYGVPANTADAGKLRAFTSALLADAEHVLGNGQAKAAAS